MKAIQFDHHGGPEVLHYRDLPDPEPGPGEVLIAVHAASVAPGDWKVRAGLLQEIFPQTFPTIPGRDGAGTVVALGSGVSDMAIGDEVCFITAHTENGAYTELVVRAAAEVVRRPANVSFTEAAAAVHAGVCAWIPLMESVTITAGQRVLVHGGSGGVGGMAVQIARNLGAEVTATCRAANAEYVRSLGADTVVAYDEQDFATELRDYDVVLDLLGSDIHRRSYAVLKPGGSLVWLIAKPIEDLGAEYGVKVLRSDIHDAIYVLQAVLDLVASGAVRPQVGRTLPLSQAAEAQHLLEAGEHSRGRIVLEVR
ncbi:MAG TPA: NADP-dependent oxidoreductase [Alphaproteobacteria bacterium]|nr:NADP-dependent oxidoreductase [Alphaproteobacteria bacterium]MDP7426841.1 NADP-dependent oxidoreductase [Alphaproteobacteria bacterium]HJM48768.1 NADP-dependent oxidoreductase [Alphaproteobacteria bacterium]